ncbi:unnamed protein product [Cylindrotheca closterium]|uniref:Uncharacterized protein n=1 Tax=Cylindrotheca closterium TaxID=2856 RepID=A0AAD2CQS1_9STRA|nr:unnamed protein product [Cylindrotheca closterium]
MTIKATRSESSLRSMRLKKLERRDQQFAVPGSKSKGRFLRNMLEAPKKEPSGEGTFMKEKYPSASIQRPRVVEYYKLNDLAGDESIRLPPRLPITQSGGARKDPRFTSSFSSLDDDQKVEELESYADEVRWFIAKVSKEVEFEDEVYPLHVAMYRIFMVLQEDPTYQYEKLPQNDRKLLFDCCVESFMQQQQEYAEQTNLPVA